MNKLLSFATAYKKWLIIGAFLIATHLGAFGYGIYTADLRNAEEAVAEAQADIAIAKNETVAVIKAADVATVQRIEVKVRDLARERLLAAELQSARDERDNLQGILHAKPDFDPDCRVAVGDLRLLDDAARPSGGDAAGGTPDPARVAAYQEQTPSAISCRAFVGAEIDVRVQYNDLAVRHDALIDWIEEEVILPQSRVDSAPH